MTAGASDLLQKVGLSTATTLSAPGYTAGGTTINIGSTTNWPSDTGVTFAIDTVTIVNGIEVQDTGSYNEYIAVVASPTSLSNVAWADGNGDRNYAAGSTTRVYIPVSKTRENRIVSWGVAEHNQDGTHSTASVTARAADTSPASGDSFVTYDTSAGALKEVLLSDAPKATAATQTDMEAQTALKMVDASNIKWSPVAVKAWTQGKYTTGTPSSAGTPYGITSYTDTGTGDVTINLSVTFSDVSNMCILANAFTNSDSIKLFATVRAFSATTARIQFFSDAGTITDPVGFMVMITGDF